MVGFRFAPTHPTLAWSPNLQIWPLESKPSDLALGASVGWVEERNPPFLNSLISEFVVLTKIR